MSSPLNAATHLVGSPDALIAAFARDPAEWLPPPARASGMDSWTVDLTAGRLSRRARCTLSRPWRTEEGLWRSIAWEPVDPVDPGTRDSRLPVLTGQLGVRTDEGLTLVLDGRYTPPGGVLGTVMDRLLLHHVAELTAREFLAAVRANLAQVAAGVESASAAPPA